MGNHPHLLKIAYCAFSLISSVCLLIHIKVVVVVYGIYVVQYVIRLYQRAVHLVVLILCYST